MITEIQPQQLAFLLGIKKNAAKRMLCSIKNIENPKLYTDYEVRISVEEFEKRKNIPIKMAIEDLYNNALTRPAFKKYLIEYPLDKLKPNSKGEYPKTVRLPYILKSMLSIETLEQLSKIWHDKYSSLVPKNQHTIFNP